MNLFVPDESGALDGHFAIPVRLMIDALSEAVQQEYLSWLTYTAYSQNLRVPHRESIIGEFRNHAEEELEHADILTRRLVALGGQVPFSIPEATPEEDETRMIQNLTNLEQQAIAKYRELIDKCGDNPLRVQLESILETEMHHLDDLWNMQPRKAIYTTAVNEMVLLDPSITGGLFL